MFEKFMKLGAGVLLLAGSLQAQAVNVTTNLGTLPVVPPATVLNGMITHPVESFTDIFNFSLPTPGLSVLLSDFEVSLAGTNIYEIGTLTAQLFSGFNAPGSAIATLAGSGTDNINDSVILAPGNYSITVSGNAIGAAGGIYAYAFAATVPEVETWAMMLVGIGLVGLRLRRRSGGTRAIRSEM